MDEYLAFAKNLARQSGSLIKDNFESVLDIQLKSDNSPVTQVDKQINDLVIQAIQAQFPGHGVLGEEANIGSGDEEFQWLCDPLDGTAAFINGIRHSTFVLGLLQNGELQLSVVYDPYNDKFYHAMRGQGAYCNDAPIHVGNQPLRQNYVIYGNSSISLTDKLLQAGALIESCPGAAYRSMLLASGRFAAIVQTKADHHDVGPASLIVEEAGGRVTDLNGSPLRFDRPIPAGIILSNGICHDQLLAVVQ